MNRHELPSDAFVPPDETRKAEKADIRSELLDTGQSILQDRGVPHTYITQRFEDRSVEGLHVNSHLFSVSVV